MALTAPPPRARRGPRAPSRRAFRHAGQLPEQPQGVEILAAVAQARARAGREQGWDARLESSLLAVHGYLWRRGRGEKWAGAQGSVRYGCSIAQLVFGLAPIMGWRGIPDRHDTAGRMRFVKRHRKSVQRWLAWLELAELVHHTPQQDEEGFWWRTIIELRPTPPLEKDMLKAARRRRLGWCEAEERRRARGRHRDLTLILRRAQLTRSQRRARAVQRRRQLCEHQARAQVRELAARSLADAIKPHLTHPFGTSTTSRNSSKETNNQSRWSRGAAGARIALPPFATEAHTDNISTETAGGDDAEDIRWAIYHQVHGLWVSRSTEAWQPHVGALVDRVGRLDDWPEEHRCPRWRLIEAWALAAHGPAMAAAGAGRLALWREDHAHHGPRLDRALARYGRYAQTRPPNWPAVPVAAFARFVTDCVSGLDGPEHGMAYDVQRFNQLTRQMSAYAHITHPDNATRAKSRARRRDAARALAEQVNA
ncbi:MAG: hypothetical protein JO130_13025, partial [Solirubrobacterales bacterium]|nr:hypothetical protein [Solirubrobacterales bacterium]